MKTTLVVIKFVLLLVLINIAGRFLWPYLAFVTGSDILLCYYISGIVALSGIVLLIIAFIMKQSKTCALWIIATACALFSSCFISIFKPYNKGGHYIDNYIVFKETKAGMEPNTHGLADKFGCEFIAPHYNWIVKAFDKKDSESIYIGIKSKEVPTEKEDSVDSIGSNPDYYTFKLHLHNEEGKLKKTIDVTESDCDFIDEHIEKHIGEILETYSYVSILKSKMRILKSKQANNETENEIASHSEEEYTDEEYETSNSDDDEEETTEIVVKHVREPQQVWKQRWKPCISCDRGKCGQCHGQGGYYIGDYYNACTSCYGTGACIWCEGRGEIMETYSVWE